MPCCPRPHRRAQGAVCCSPVTVAALPGGQLHTSASTGCPFCTVLDREPGGRCAGCGATHEQRAQAVLAAELDRALCARGGGRRRTGRTAWRPQRGPGTGKALSEAVRKRSHQGRHHPRGLRERRRPRAGEGAPVMIAVCVLVLAAIIVARIALALLAGAPVPGCVRGPRRWRFWRWPSCTGRCGWAGVCRGTGPGRCGGGCGCACGPGPDQANWAELVWRWGRFAAWRRSKMAARRYPAGAATCGPARIHTWSRGPTAGTRCGCPFEDHLLIMAPPRRHKTALLARLLQRFPGPAVATAAQAGPVRAHIRPALARRPAVLVFNPQNLSGLPSSFALARRWTAAARRGRGDPPGGRVRGHGQPKGRGAEGLVLVPEVLGTYLRALFLRRGDRRPGHAVRSMAGCRPRTPAEPSAILAPPPARATGPRRWPQLGGEARKTAATVPHVNVAGAAVPSLTLAPPRACSRAPGVRAWTSRRSCASAGRST